MRRARRGARTCLVEGDLQVGHIAAVLLGDGARGAHATCARVHVHVHVHACGQHASMKSARACACARSARARAHAHGMISTHPKSG